MMEPPVRTPGQPLGTNGCQFAGWMYAAPAKMNARMAAIFSNTMMLLVSADSRIPRTSTTVKIMTIRNAGQLNPKCQPSLNNGLPCRSDNPLGKYAGEIHLSGGCQPNQSIRFTSCW